MGQMIGFQWDNYGKKVDFTNNIRKNMEKTVGINGKTVEHD
jgi:hypothetical protein